MVYTLGVRMSVCRRILSEKLGIDEDAFEKLVDQELADRKVAAEKAQEEARATAHREAAEKAVTGITDAVAVDDNVEVHEFGGDFGQPDVEEETADQADTGEDSGRGGAGEPD